MCGRFAFYSPHESVVRLFKLPPDAPAVEPRYNIAPTQYVATVRAEPGGRRSLAMLYWGLVPSWAKEKSMGARMINARAETLAEKPSFRNAYRRRRCLVLADGYYEWQRTATAKQPYFVSLATREPFGMAGLWESWMDPATGSPLESCAIITTSPVDAIGHIHDRMPVILPRAVHDAWLDPASTEAAALDRLLAPCVDPLLAYPVSPRVNNARNEGPDLVQPLVSQDAGS